MGEDFREMEAHAHGDHEEKDGGWDEVLHLILVGRV
jgi:hypothetical protein